MSCQHLEKPSEWEKKPIPVEHRKREKSGIQSVKLFGDRGLQGLDKRDIRYWVYTAGDCKFPQSKFKNSSSWVKAIQELAATDEEAKH